VLTALAWTPDEFCCGVDIVGPSGLRTLLAAIPAYWEPMRKLLSDERIGDDPALLAAQSPLGKAWSIRSPLLIVHGANDPRVRRQESDQIVSVLRAKGTPVEYMVLDDEGHGVSRTLRISSVSRRSPRRTPGVLVRYPVRIFSARHKGRAARVRWCTGIAIARTSREHRRRCVDISAQCSASRGDQKPHPR